MLGWLGRGLLLGVAWGVAARIFMRLLSTTPEFTWAGTVSIVGMSAVFWGGIGLVVGARRAQRSRWWRLAPLPGLLLFAGPGLVLLPGAVGTALAVGAVRRHGRAALPVALVALGAGLAATLMGTLSGEEATTPTPTAWAGVALLVAATLGLGLGLHAWWRSWVPAGRAVTAGGGLGTSVATAAYDVG